MTCPVKKKQTKKKHLKKIILNKSERAASSFLLSYQRAVMLRSSCTGNSGFLVSEWEISTGTPVEVGIPSGKVGESHQPRVVNGRWLSWL